MRVGILGLGSIGQRHATNASAAGHEVIGYDPWGYGLCIIGRNWTRDEVLQAEAIVIASPTKEHAEDLRCAALKKPKCILVEKPLGEDREVYEGLNLAKDYNSTVHVGYNLRFHSSVKKAKEWLPEIGRPIWSSFVCAQHNDKPAYLRDGVILNWSHEIDLALYLLGPAKVTGSATRLTNGKDDLVDILLEHKDLRSTIHLDYLTEPERRGFTIVGTKGSIKANLVTRTVWLKTQNRDEMFKGCDTWNENYKEEMQSFLGDKHLLCTGDEGLEVLKICLEVRKQAGL